MALVGNMLAIALENPGRPARSRRHDHVLRRQRPGGAGLQEPVHAHQRAGEARPSAGVVAVTPLPGGRYLMMITGGEHNTTWYFYRSTLTDLSSPDLAWDLVGHVPSPFEDPTNGRPSDADIPPAKATSTGRLYLAGARGHPVFADHDRIDLFYVAYQPPRAPGARGRAAPGRPPGKPITPCPTAADSRSSPISPRPGFHVTPSGELIFYATEHDNDGPAGTVKTGEWRHIEVVREGSPTLLPTALVDGPYEVDEGRAVSVTGIGRPAGDPRLPPSLRRPGLRRALPHCRYRRHPVRRLRQPERTRAVLELVRAGGVHGLRRRPPPARGQDAARNGRISSAIPT